MSIPTAGNISEALMSIYKTLDDNGLVKNADVIWKIATLLNRNKASTSWSINVDRGEPILFKQTKDEDGRDIVPQITAEELNFDGTQDFPFLKWNIALEVFYTTGEALARWHFDLANPSQDGPKLHMQYGGRFGGDRSKDMKLKVPRWHSPAMDIILLTEIVTANFYTREWKEIRDNRNWCKYIHQSQQFCLESYLKKMTEAMCASSCTILNLMWSDRWK